MVHTILMEQMYQLYLAFWHIRHIGQNMPQMPKQERRQIAKMESFSAISLQLEQSDMHPNTPWCHLLACWGGMTPLGCPVTVSEASAMIISLSSGNWGKKCPLPFWAGPFFYVVTES